MCGSFVPIPNLGCRACGDGFEHEKPSVTKGTYFIDINMCTRCKSTHAQLNVHVFHKPVEIGDRVFTHWAMCPAMKEPMLLQIIMESD